MKTKSIAENIAERFGVTYTPDEPTQAAPAKAAETVAAPVERKSWLCEECETIHRSGCPKNKPRAVNAYKALEYFAKNGGEYFLLRGKRELDKDMVAQNMGDLFCNFAHLCDVRGISFADALRSGQSHYNAETGDKGEQEFFAS